MPFWTKYYILITKWFFILSTLYSNPFWCIFSQVDTEQWVVWQHCFASCFVLKLLSLLQYAIRLKANLTGMLYACMHTYINDNLYEMILKCMRKVTYIILTETISKSNCLLFQSNCTWYNRNKLHVEIAIFQQNYGSILPWIYLGLIQCLPIVLLWVLRNDFMSSIKSSLDSGNWLDTVAKT